MVLKLQKMKIIKVGNCCYEFDQGLIMEIKVPAFDTKPTKRHNALSEKISFITVTFQCYLAFLLNSGNHGWSHPSTRSLHQFSSAVHCRPCPSLSSLYLAR